MSHQRGPAGPTGLLFLAAWLTAAPVAAQERAELDALLEAGLPHQRIDLPAERVASLELPVILGDEPCTLELVAHTVRSARFELWLADEHGLRRAGEAEAPSTYVGRVPEWPGARVVASLRSDGLHATVLGGPLGVPWAIQPAERRDPEGARLHVAYSGADVLLPPDFCAVLAEAAPDSFEEHAPGTLPLLGGVQVAELAIDADFPYFRASGGTLRDTLAAIESTLLFTNLIYEHQLGVRHEVVGGVVRTSPACVPGGSPLCDPYPSSQQSCFLLRSHFANHWTLHFQQLHRDVAHLFTARGLSGTAIGCAGVTGMCSMGAYAVSQRQYFDLSTAVLVAHELGHIWGACHCNVDMGGSACDTYDPSGCGIMNSGLWTGPPAFGPAEVATLLARVAILSGCLDPAAPSPAPVLLDVEPRQVQVFAGGPVTLTGDELEHTLFVHFGAATLDLRHFAALDEHTLVLDAPTGSALGQAAVVVQGPGGSSQPLRFEFVETSPPAVRGDYTNGWLPAGLTHTWTFGARVGHKLDLLLSFDDLLVGPPGRGVLANAFVLHSEVLTAPGVGSFMTQIPLAWAGRDAWVQAVLSEDGRIVEVSELLRHDVDF